MNKWIKGNLGLIVFFSFFGFFRTAIADWNPAPTASMRPNVAEGDVVPVNRLAYDFKLPLTDIVVTHLGEPKRGDIVTFYSPNDGTRLIKRIVGLPGDVVEMRNEMLFVNGDAAVYGEPELRTEPGDGGADIPALRLTETLGRGARRIQWLRGVPAANTFGPIRVPDGHYFMLGDNRDNSKGF